MPAAAGYHPEEDEELAKAEEDEMHSGNSNSNRCRLSSTFSWTALIAGLAVVGVVVGGGSVVIRAARGKTPISSNNMQVQEAVVAEPIAIEDYDYVLFGAGTCKGDNGAGTVSSYPKVLLSATTANECAANCACAQGIEGVTLRGFTFVSGIEYCLCQMDPLTDGVVTELEASCINSKYDQPCCGSPIARGKITTASGGGTCYEFKGSSSKAGKAKAPKRG